MKKYLKFTIILLLAVSAFSCKKKEEKDEYADVKGSYFSIKQFGLDQWHTFYGEPFVIVKTVKVNDKTDSSYTNSDTISWAPIFETFFKTDISDHKFLGKYTFTQFDDNADLTHNFFYQANDPDLFTQKLLITMDQQTARVSGIYIETLEHTFWDDVTQKLFYNPMKIIQIQTDDKPRFSSKKFTVVEYDFKR